MNHAAQFITLQVLTVLVFIGALAAALWLGATVRRYRR